MAEILSSLISLTSVVFIQFTLFAVACFFPTSSLFTLVLLSVLLIVIMVGVGRYCKRLVGVKASAPAFVIFNIIFIWLAFISVVRQVVSSFLFIMFNTEIAMLFMGLYRTMSSDPGVVTSDSSHDDTFINIPPNEDMKPSTCVMQQESPAKEGLSVHGRIRYCKHCKVYVRRFDHHCPAFGNCIGQKNCVLFLILLIGFLVCESSYVVCASKYLAKSPTLNEVGVEATSARNLVTSTMLFSLFHVIWQVVFLTWHVYCACFNITTDEWINWKKYPDFQITGVGQHESGLRFSNPYDKGILQNLKEFLITGH